LAGTALMALSIGTSGVAADETSTSIDHLIDSFSSRAWLRPGSSFGLQGHVGTKADLGSRPVLPSSSFETDEYRRSWFLDRIHAPDAYALGYTGKGVLVAVVDTGLDVDHPEFAGRISPLLRSFAVNEAPNSMSDIDQDGEIEGHGTHVAGIIGAARNDVGTQGVAYNATILPLRAVDIEGAEDGDAPTSLALYHAARSGAKVLNGSYGPDALPPRWIESPGAPGSYMLNPHHQVMPYSLVIGEGIEDEYKAVKAAAKADIVLVFAAGNEYQDQPISASNPSGIGFYPYIRPGNHQNGVYRILEVDDQFDPDNPATYTLVDPADPDLAALDFSDLQGALITVVSTDRNNKIASYSNRCGVTFLWCLAAPGGDHAQPGQAKDGIEILSTYPYSSYEMMVGTSMASPVVAGGAAVLREAFPYMTARQIIEIMLTTTDQIGAREIYGRGLFNLGRAVKGPREFGAEGFAQTFDVNTKGYDTIWSNDIIGTGGLIKRGDGNLVLTGTNSYASGTNVLGGVMTLTGSVASQMVIGRQGTLRGTGRINAPLQLAGTLEPGSATPGSFGTLTVTGDAALQASSTYRVDANSQGEHDRLVVGGTTTLAGGALEIVLADGLAPYERPIEIISSAGVATGVFGRLQTNSISDFLDPQVRMRNGNVVVIFERNEVPLASAETHPDDKDVADALDALGSESQLDDAMLRLDAGAADKAFDQVAGEAHASAATVAYGDARLVQNTLMGRLRAPLSGAPLQTVSAAYAADTARAPQPVTVAYPTLDPRRFALWGEGFGSWGRVGHNGNAHNMDTSTGGFILGAEALLDSTYRIGAAGGFTSSRFDVDALSSSGENQTVFGALYGSAQWGGISLRLGAAYAGHDFDVQRTISFPGFFDRAEASYNGSTVQAFGEVGYTFALGRAKVEPIAGASVLRLRTDSFQENGRDAALIGYGRTYDLATTTLGLRAEARISNDIPLTLRGMVGWRHAYGDIEPEALMAFAGGTAAFTVSGTPVDRDALVAGAGLDWQASQAISLGVSYNGQIGERAQDHALKGNFTWRF
jgi:subtilase-type serine protease